MSGFADHLAQALADLGSSLTSQQLTQLDQHWQLLLRWNARVNLTSITDASEAARLHYRDSLAALPLLSSGPVVDLGSGGGFPGVPLAVARPDLAFTLVEPRRKRASFLRTAVGELGLRNVDVLEARHDDAPPRTFAAAVTRATFSNPEDLAACLRWLGPGGRLVTYRSEPWTGATPSEAVSYRVGSELRLLAVFSAPS